MAALCCWSWRWEISVPPTFLMSPLSSGPLWKVPLHFASRSVVSELPESPLGPPGSDHQSQHPGPPPRHNHPQIPQIPVYPLMADDLAGDTCFVERLTGK